MEAIMATKKIRYLLLALALTTAAPVTYTARGGEANIEETIYAGMDYAKIFDQSVVLARFPHILRQEGLDVPKETASEVGKQEGRLKQFGHLITCGYCRKKNSYQELDRGAHIEMPSAEQAYESSKKLSEALDEALVADFRSKKKNAMRRSLYKPLFAMGIPIAFTAAASHYITNTTGAGFSQFVLVQMLSDMAQQYLGAAYCFISPLGDPLNELEELYAKRKRFFPKELRAALEDKFGAARKSPQDIEGTLKYARIALNLPLQSEQLAMPSSSDLVELMGGYEPNLDEKLTTKMFHHCKRISHKAEALNTPKSVLYLQGEPGTGKTHVATQLATLMGANLIELKASDDPASIVGTEDSPGSFLEAIAKEGITRNAIIFIDEADRVLNKEDAPLQLFLPLLEPDAKYFYSPYLRSNIDISHFCFVLAGNHEIKDAALKSRLAVIEFKGMTKEFKESIVMKMVTKMLPTGHSIKEIKELVDADNEPGVRKLRLAISDLIDKHELEMHMRT